MPLKQNNGVEVTLPPLTNAQKQAVFADSGPILADAVPGSGKTRTITCRLAYLAELFEPENILAITFTKSAAAEMSIRARALIGTAGKSPKVTHFHSFTYHLLQDLWSLKRLPIVEPERILNKLGSIYQDLTGGNKADKQTLENYLQLISRAKSLGLNRSRDAEEIQLNLKHWSPEADLIGDLWNQLDDWYRQYSLLDFDDLLNRAVEEVNTLDDWRARLHAKYRHILVDEFQDTNPPQWALVRSIVENRPVSSREAGTVPCPSDFDWNNRSLLACGDGDQSIFGFRSADVTNILHFNQVYQDALVVELKTNYRSVSIITDCANRLINNNRQRRNKTIEANRPSGAKIALIGYHSDEEPNRRIARLMLDLYDGQRSIAILSRHHETLNQIREVCESIGIPTDSSGGLPFSETRQLQTVRRWITAAFDLHDSHYLLASLAEAGENETWQQRMRQASAFSLSLWELLWQLEDLNEQEEEFFSFLLELNQMLKQSCFSAAIEHCFNRIKLFDELCEGRDPARTGKLLEALSLMKQIEVLEKLPDAGRDDLLNLLQNNQSHKETKAVSLLTIHASKGLEFDAAIVVDVNDGVLPQFESIDEEEERRLFYVAITRAVNRLVLCFNKNNPSRFMREITAAREGDFIRLEED